MGEGREEEKLTVSCDQSLYGARPPFDMSVRMLLKKEICAGGVAVSTRSTGFGGRGARRAPAAASSAGCGCGRAPDSRSAPASRSGGASRMSAYSSYCRWTASGSLSRIGD
eukprot:373654-Prymnesium_polylepis.2